MNLEIARGLFLVGALGVASLAAAAWHEPGPQVLGSASAKAHCPLPAPNRGVSAVKADGNLLLLMLGLSQGVVGPQR
ncbi:hypothetical protein D9M68_471610 [compost metagenome]